MSCAALNSISARTGAGTSRHVSYARAAASIAASTSARFDFWKIPIRSSPSAGLRFSKVWPDAEGTQRPSM